MDTDENLPVRVRPHERRRKAAAAVGLRVAGASYEEIAKALGYNSAQFACIAVEKALAGSVDDAERERMRQIEGRRLDRLLRGVWNKAIDPSSVEQVNCVRAARELIDRRIKLFGLDAPTEVVVHTPTTTEIERWVAQMLSSGEQIIDAVVVEDEPNAIEVAV